MDMKLIMLVVVPLCAQASILGRHHLVPGASFGYLQAEPGYAGSADLPLKGYEAVPLYKTYPVIHKDLPLVYDGGYSNVGDYHGKHDKYHEIASDAAAKEKLFDSKHSGYGASDGEYSTHLIAEDGIKDGYFNQANKKAAYDHDAFDKMGEAKIDIAKHGKDYGEKGRSGHNKQHKSTGFNRSYTKFVEGKDHSFLDEKHDAADKKFGGEHEDITGNTKWTEKHFKGADSEAAREDVGKAAASGLFKESGVVRHDYDTKGSKYHYDDRDLEYDQGLRYGKAEEGGHHGFNSANSGFLYRDVPFLG